jgi:hypothetical protein
LFDLALELLEIDLMTMHSLEFRQQAGEFALTVLGYAIGFGLTDQIPVALDFGQIATINCIAEKLAHFNEHNR